MSYFINLLLLILCAGLTLFYGTDYAKSPNFGDGFFVCLHIANFCMILAIVFAEAHKQ